MASCKDCNGSGRHPKLPGAMCPDCRGTGVDFPKVRCPDCHGTGNKQWTSGNCLRCFGKGMIIDLPQIQASPSPIPMPPMPSPRVPPQAPIWAPPKDPLLDIAIRPKVLDGEWLVAPITTTAIPTSSEEAPKEWKPDELKTDLPKRLRDW